MKHAVSLPVFILALALFGALAAPVPAVEPDVNQLYLEGLSSYQEGNFPAAEKKFGQALTKNPKHLSSLYMLGETLAKDVRRLREAEGWYKKALEAGARDKVYSSKTRMSLGVLYIEMGLYEQAVDFLQELVSSAPDYYDMPKVYNYLGVARYHLDRYDESLESFKRALKLDPNLLEATFNMKTLQGQLSLLNIARYYERMGDEKAAAEQYEKAIEAYPDYVAAWYHLGLLQVKKGDYAKAIKLLARAKALNPQYLGGSEIPYQLAGAYAASRQPGELDEAMKLYQRNPSYKDSMLRMGMILLEQGQLDGAEEDLMEVARSAQDKKTQAEAWYQLGRLCLVKDDKDRAAEFFGKALEIMPGDERYKNPPRDAFK
ncbi:MAG TPA: tetratricopeptide repeat protein [Nitrospirota bacterium]|nr:tetratricopeptide repeat protein [Nitrospirota bacterium]